jgi:hypothetical protein
MGAQSNADSEGWDFSCSVATPSIAAGHCDGHHKMSDLGDASELVHSSGETDRGTPGRNQRLDGQRWVNSKEALR